MGMPMRGQTVTRNLKTHVYGGSVVQVASGGTSHIHFVSYATYLSIFAII